ncbi:MAG: type II toxin-antitoxin system VapC family toxin [Pyrinomonadaceae bacterium]
MKPTVYLETSIISYLAARPSKDAITAGHQLTTTEWWNIQRANFQIVASELVIQEASLGNAQMASKRIGILKSMTILPVRHAARELAKDLVAANVVPEKAAADALHIAIAAIEKIDFLATWNFKHIANAFMQGRIEEAIHQQGFVPSKICTLEELLGE